MPTSISKQTIRRLVPLLFAAAQLIYLCQFSFAQSTTQDYSQELKNYDQRIQQEKELYAQQTTDYERQLEQSRQEHNRIILPLFIILGALFLLQIFSRIAITRRMHRWTTSMDQSLQQSRRMIELLESIDNKLKPPPA